MAAPLSAITPRLPVVILGETHTDAAQLRMEVAALRRLRKIGYDTVEIEYPRDLAPAAQAYLATDHSNRNYRAFLRNVLEISLGKEFRVAPEWQKKKAIAGQMEETAARYARRLMERAADLGYRVCFCDVTTTELENIPATLGEKEIKALPRRNGFMARHIAAEVKNGHGVVAIHGLTHLVDFGKMSGSLKTDLARRGVESRTIALALDGGSPRRAAGIPPKYFKSVDHLARSGAEVEKFVRSDLGLRTR